MRAYRFSEVVSDKSKTITIAPMFSFFSEVEAGYLRRFFDGVDYAVSRELAMDEVAYEEFLSPMFGRLLDGRSPFQSVLTYPIRALNADLDECGSGHRLKVEFETIEHAKSFSGAVSHADLGIVFRYENPAFGERVEKSILVECKRLYPAQRKYKLRSRYEGFDAAQFLALKGIDEKHGWGNVFYFLYNPVLEAFEPTDLALIRALENRMTPYAGQGLNDPRLLRRFYEFYGHPRFMPALMSAHGLHAAADTDEARKAMTESTSRRPGLRVLSLTSIENLNGRGRKPAKFALADCYRHAREDRWMGLAGAVPFVPLSSFLVDFMMACVRGSTDADILAMASGKTPDGKANSEEGVNSVLARHVLQITLSSSLSAEEGLFRQG